MRWRTSTIMSLQGSTVQLLDLSGLLPHALRVLNRRDRRESRQRSRRDTAELQDLPVLTSHSRNESVWGITSHHHVTACVCPIANPSIKSDVCSPQLKAASKDPARIHGDPGSGIIMKIHEYQAKAILKKYGVAVPRGEMAETREEAESGAKKSFSAGATGVVGKAPI